MEAMEFQLSYFKFQKVMLLKCYTQYARKYGNLNSGHRTRSFHFNPRGGQCQRMFKLSHTYTLILHGHKVMLKILQARLQQYMNHELQMFKLDLEKAEELEIKLPTSLCSLKK